uniref:Uncharacterized protein n=1 Tax=Nephroselmis olivacea TaxID=31312 RepID=Q9T317_NEPOL|nr:hypothetical protein NeolCp103 [Nephroselmis olivacea]NP_050939.1 hypothetical protein NeolCp134 [Nephroselmis olivacea]AAD54879.1 unknown [Nephroselmis olivacea]AAD54910.1 unknown [Nephroselmis olivacea]
MREDHLWRHTTQRLILRQQWETAVAPPRAIHNRALSLASQHEINAYVVICKLRYRRPLILSKNQHFKIVPSYTVIESSDQTIPSEQRKMIYFVALAILLVLVWRFIQRIANWIKQKPGQSNGQ